MSMSEPPRRKRFQIHLSTAIVMMFVAGACIAINTTPSTFKIISLDGEEATIMINYPGADLHYNFYGFPGYYLAQYMNPVAPEFNNIVFFRGWMLTLDAMIGFSTVTIAYVFSELLIRRRAAQKGA